jgi:hypothetical protein
MKKIGIFCLGARREEFAVAHAYELSKCKYDNYQFYLLGNETDNSIKNALTQILGDKVSIYQFDTRNNYNYMMKVIFALDQNHEFSIKHDEDCFMKSESWDKLFSNIENMTSDDLLCTGAISSGIPTVEMFLENHTPEIKDEIYEIFKQIKLGNHGADYTSINYNYETWNPDIFYERVKNFDHYYKGIHPIRIDFSALKKINDYILEHFDIVMSLKDKPVIRDNSKYPYFCNNIFGIRTDDWKKLVSSKELYVDGFDEVPLNRYRALTNKNFVFDTGIPIIHTMYNWSPEFVYEKEFIHNIMKKVLV